MKPYALFYFLFVLNTLVLHGQKSIDIKFSSGVSHGPVHCYDIQLRSADGYDIHLAGQNYRIFYNGQETSFIEDKTSHNLDYETYGKLDIKNTVTRDIGFVSLSLDSRIMTDKVVTLNRSGQWVNTLNLCFEHSSKLHQELTWARVEKTGQFATAEVAISEWLDQEEQQILSIHEMTDTHSNESHQKANRDIIMSVFPNPTVENIHVQIQGQHQAKRIVIKDVIGRQVANQPISGGDYFSYDLSKWSPGGYVVMMVDDKNQTVISKNIIKVKP